MFLLLLEALHFFCMCLPTLQTSSQFAWPHIHEFFALPSRRSPELRQPCFSSPCFAWLTGIELHGTLSRARRCLCLQASNCLSQEEHCSWVGLLLQRDICTWPMGLASLNVPGELVKPRRLVAHRSYLLLGLTWFSSQCRCSPHLLGHFVRVLFVPLGLPRVSAPGSLCSVPPLGSSIVVHHLYPRTSADREHASVDEDDFAFRGFSEAIAICQQPPSRPSTGSRGLLAGWLRGFSLLSLHLVWSSGRNFRLVFGRPFSADQNSDQFSDMHQFVLHIAQFLDPLCVCCLDPSPVLGFARQSRPSPSTPSPWTRHRVISCCFSGSSSASSPEVMLTKRSLKDGKTNPNPSNRSKSDSSARLSKTVSAGMGSFLFLLSCSSQSSSSSAVLPEEWTLVFVCPRGYLPPCQCAAPSALLPSSARFEPVADSSDQLSPAHPEGTVWLQTPVFFLHPILVRLVPGTNDLQLWDFNVLGHLIDCLIDDGLLLQLCQRRAERLCSQCPSVKHLNGHLNK